MANVKIHVKLILQLRDAGMSRQEIASTRHISRNSVSEVFRIADEKGIHYADVRNLGENEVYRIIYPDKHQEEVMFEAPYCGWLIKTKINEAINYFRDEASGYL